MDYLASWSKHILERPSSVLRGTVVVEGLRDVHMAARWDYAKVTFRIEPSENFIFEIGLEDKVKSSTNEAFVIAALFGLLDTILVADLTPYRNVRITLTNLSTHEVDSNQLAFYRAGREAGKRFLEEANRLAYQIPG
jgi:Elongation factor G, domain IV